MPNTHKDSSLFNNISNVIKPIIEKRGIYIYKIIEDWHKIVKTWDIIQQLQKKEPQISSKIIPIKIEWSKKSQTGTLYVSVPYEYHIFVNHDNLSLKTSLNKYFGYYAIKSIIFIKT